MKKDDISTFDPQEDFSVVERSLPHWSQAGTVCFITWRLADSLPQHVLQQLDEQIEQLLAAEQLPVRNWQSELAQRDPGYRGKVYWQLFRIRDKFMDAGHGACWLASPAAASEVLNALRHFDEDRYFLTDAVVMPNHVHFLCAFPGEAAMLKQCRAWKQFTARRLNQLAGRSGQFWQVDQYDHLIRSPAQFTHYRSYIRMNPAQAGLPDDAFRHYSKSL